MANPVKGEVPLSLSDGRDFILVMDFDMRCQVEDLCNKPFAEVAQEASKGFHRAIRALVWGALQRHHSNLSMGDVTELIEQDAKQLEGALVQALSASAPAAEGGNAKNPIAGRPHGKTSGLNGAKPASTRKPSGAQLPAPMA